MGRYCKICGASRPNEHFGGKGLRRVVCKKCRALPKEVKEMHLATHEIYGFLDQKNISNKNIKRLIQLASIADPGFQLLRCLVLEIAFTKPGKTKRWSFLRQHHRELYLRIRRSRLFGHSYYQGDGRSFDPDDYDDEEFEFDHFEDVWDVWLENEDVWNVWLENIEPTEGSSVRLSISDGAPCETMEEDEDSHWDIPF